MIVDPMASGSAQDEAASGIFYRIAPKGFKPQVPALDLGTIAGAITALKSPAVNVRSLGYQKLKAAGPAAYDAVAMVLEASNPYVAARAIWLMPYLGEKGIAKLDSLITSAPAANRLTAFRAIRRTDGAINALSYARKLASDPGIFQPHTGTGKTWIVRKGGGVGGDHRSGKAGNDTSNLPEAPSSGFRRSRLPAASR